MSQLDTIIAQIALALSITSLDVYVFFSMLVAMGIIIALGLPVIYNLFFGTVLGMGIFVLFSTILSPEFQTPETLSIVSETFAQILIGSSVYLIFILMVLVPLNGGISVTLPRTQLGKVFQTLFLSLGFLLFFGAVFLWLVERNYIFLHTESAFVLLKRLVFYGELQSTLLFSFILSHIPTIIILSIGFIIYKILFADIVYGMITSLVENIKKRQSTSSGGHHDGGHEEHDDAWHEEFFEEEVEHHGGHGHH